MDRLPQKSSLVTQTAAIVRQEIESGRWTGWLPGEHELSAQLHVSRRTLRAALERLGREGVIRCQHGRRREIILRRPRRRKAAEKRIVVLLRGPVLSLSPFVAFLIERLRKQVMEEGYLLEIRGSGIPYQARASQGLETLARTLDPAGWVLHGSTELMQRWFATRHLPCVVLGSVYNAIDLPSVDWDYAAVCQHAVNQFVAHGHRRLVLLNPQPAAAGDVMTAVGFRDAMARVKVAGVQGSVQEHRGSVASICARLDALMSSPQPPTAFIVSRARHVLTVLGHLMSIGKRVPKDVALIARDNEAFLEDVVPAITRYSHEPGLFASKVSRLVMDMVHGEGRVRSYKIMPDFVRGQTLG
jgi:DNA-binding LacI/PurR family transcriptional regulator